MNLCIAHPGLPKTRGSFIDNQIAFLNPDVELYFHQYPIYANGSLIFKFLLNIWIFRIAIKNITPWLYHWLHQVQVVKLLKKNRITVVLAEYGLLGASLYKACKKAKTPLVIHFHGYDAYKYNVIDKFTDQYKSMFKYASSIIAVSDDMVKQLIYLGADPQKVKKITYGVDVNKFSITDASMNPPLFITVGNFTPKKAPDLTIKAFYIVLKEFPEARLKMIGDGEMLDECQKLAKELNIYDKVSFLGKLNFEQIASHMQSARVFLQHSIRPKSGDSEGSPNAILEASSCGLPVVSTRHAGITETVIHKETGFLVEEKDYQMMAYYMKKFILEPKIASQMGKRGRAHVVNNYTLQNQLNELKAELLKVSN